jgi:hypothetical protein
MTTFHSHPHHHIIYAVKKGSLRNKLPELGSALHNCVYAKVILSLKKGVIGGGAMCSMFLAKEHHNIKKAI